MDLSTVEIPREGAREQAAEYRRLAKDTRDPLQRRELERIAAAYKACSREGVALIALTPTLAAGGTVTRTLVRWRGTQNESRTDYLLPALAICRWEARFCYSLGIQSNGSVEFIDSLRRDYRYQKGRITLDAGTFERPADSYRAGETIARWTSGAWAAMVPIVPPKHRPARMGDRLVLWEVENWRWDTVPQPPGDPALLRHVGGDLYAVEAVWELTELEKLVLSERRR